jgi:hypothetical protein
MLMPRKSILIAGAVLVAAVLYLLCASAYMKIDRCLDADGRWNHELKRCELGR